MTSKKQPRKRLNREYIPEYYQLAKEHVDSGRSLMSFCGEYAIPPDLWGKWVQWIPELIELNKQYKEKINAQRRFKNKIGWYEFEK